jgi:hypothetical protein
MLYKEIIAVCSEIHTKHINTVWAENRISECYYWRYVQKLLGFKRLRFKYTVLYNCWLYVL